MEYLQQFDYENTSNTVKFDPKTQNFEKSTQANIQFMPRY